MIVHRRLHQRRDPWSAMGAIQRAGETQTSNAQQAQVVTVIEFEDATGIQHVASLKVICPLLFDRAQIKK